MKKFVSLALIAASLAVSARALVVGADAGYLIDAEEEYISGRIGHAFASNDSLVHHVELELGYTSQKEAGAKGSFLPVTVNYRAESIAANKLGFYYGVGGGFARTKVSLPGSGVPTISDSGTSFAAQAFVGLSYQVSANGTFHLGAKYIWIDDVELLGIDAEVGDDIALSAGFSVKF
jgi:opacity protein-like surface antigen